MPDIPLTLSGVVAVAPNSVSIAGLTARAGDTDLTGSARIERGSRLKVTADLTAGVLDLNPWLPHGTSKPTQTEEMSLLGWSVAGDRPVPVEMLRTIDADLHLKVGRLLVSALQFQHYTLDARLDRGLLDVSQALSAGNMQLHTRLDSRTAVPAAAIRFSARDLDLEELKATAKRAAGAKLPRLSVTTELAGFGTTTQAIYASAQGNSLFTAGPGRVQAVASPFVIQGLFVDLLGVLTPGRKPDDYSELECAAGRFDIANGIGNSPDGIALRFKHMDILGSGAINLSTGEILFGFKAVRRQLFSFSPIGLASGFAEISGTLDHPKVGLDPEGLLVKGTAAATTLGISLLASDFLHKLQATKDPCAQIVAKGHTAADPLDALIRALPLPGANTVGQPSAPSKPAQ